MSVFDYGKNEIIINMNEHCLNFDAVKKIIAKYKRNYHQALEKIRHNLLLDYSPINLSLILQSKLKQKNIVKNIIKDVFNEFEILNKKPLYVYLFGSYACNMNRYDSDIDLSMVYSEEDYNELFPVEELIDYILSQIFDTYRDQIHTMMHYTVDHSIKNFSYNGGVKFTLKWSDGNKINYTCRPNRESLLYKVHKCNRSLENLKNYLKTHINENCCEEWIIKFDTVYSNIDFDINDYIHKLEAEVNFNKTSITEFIEDTKKRIKLIKSKNAEEITDIGEFKKFYKDEITKLTNKTFNIARRVRLKYDKDVELLDYSIYLYYISDYSLFDKNKVNELNNSLLSYLQVVSHISYVFHENKIIFSHHSETDLKNALLICGIDEEQMTALTKKRGKVLNLLQTLLNDLEKEIDE